VNSHFGSLESWWTPKFSESNGRGQNSWDGIIPHIIAKILKSRCPKWVRMTHLGPSTISYGQEKGRESNWQFDSRPLKVGNRPDLLVCKWHATYCWKVVNKGYNFALGLTSIEGLHAKLWASKVTKVPILGISRLLIGSPGTKWNLGAGPMARDK
jgi:hypothetical protein